MKHKEHWYITFFCICPACGRQSTHKERVYGVKPQSGTHVTTEVYDYCIEQGRL